MRSQLLHPGYVLRWLVTIGCLLTLWMGEGLALSARLVVHHWVLAEEESESSGERRDEDGSEGGKWTDARVNSKRKNYVAAAARSHGFVRVVAPHSQQRNEPCLSTARIFVLAGCFGHGLPLLC